MYIRALEGDVIGSRRCSTQVGRTSCFTEDVLYVESSKQDSSQVVRAGRQAVFTPYPGDEAEEFDNDLLRPRKVHCTKWKPHQAVYCHLARAQEKGIAVWADKVSRHQSRFRAGRRRRQKFVLKTLHASAEAAATAGAELRQPKEHKETCCGGKESIQS